MASLRYTAPGFYSYKHLGGADRVYLDELRINLEHDLLTVTGLPIKLWQDVDAIKWGQEWRKAIDKGLAEAAFFIPVITPGYLFSDTCRNEFEKFAAFEKKRRRTDLILPLIYVQPDDFNDEKTGKQDSIIRLCLERQYVNWEDLRGLGDQGSEYRTRLTTLSKRIRELLKTLPGSSPAGTATARKKTSRMKKKPGPRKSGVTTAQSSDSIQLSPTEATKDEGAAPTLRTLYVNRLGIQGTFQTIARALEAAQGGDRILVAPGHYSESIVLNKPVMIVGEGNLGDVTVSVAAANVVIATTPFGRLQNLTLRQNGEGKFSAIKVNAGSLEVDSCEVTSAGLSCIGIQIGGELRVRRSRLHGSPQSGVAFFANTKGLVEECEIYDNGFSGITLSGSGDVTIRNNKIRDGRGGGIRIANRARGLIEDNEIFANELSGVEITQGADPTVRRNRIYDGKQAGIYVARQSKGTIVQNKISGNAFSGVEICDGSIPSISDNDIWDNRQAGIYVQRNGNGVIENNRIERNGYSGALVEGGAKPQLRNNRFIENGQFGIAIMDDGTGVFEGNELRGNKAGDKHIDPAAAAKVQWKDEVA